MNFYEMLDQMTGDKENWSKDYLNYSLEFAQEKGKIDDWLANCVEKVISLLENWKEAGYTYILKNIDQEETEETNQEEIQKTLRINQTKRLIEQPLIEYLNSNTMYIIDKEIFIYYFNNNSKVFKEYDTDKKIEAVLWLCNTINNLLNGFSEKLCRMARVYLRSEGNITNINSWYEASLKTLTANIIDAIHNRVLGEIHNKELGGTYELLIRKMREDQPKIINYILKIKKISLNDPAYRIIIAYLAKQEIAKFKIFQDNWQIRSILQTEISTNPEEIDNDLTDLLYRINVSYPPNSPLRIVYEYWRGIIDTILD